MFGIILVLCNLLFLCLTIAKMDFAKIYSMTNYEEGNLNPLYHWVLLQLITSSLISFIYLIYGSLFHLNSSSCLGIPPLPSLQYLWKDWVDAFLLRFTWIYFGMLVCYCLTIYFLIRPMKKLHIAVYVILIVLYLLGVGGRAMGGFVNNSHISVFGVCG